LWKEHRELKIIKMIPSLLNEVEKCMKFQFKNQFLLFIIYNNYN